MALNTPVGKYFRKAYQDFSGGLNNYQSALIIPANQFTTLNNALVNSRGILQKAPGYTLDAAAFSSNANHFIRMAVNHKRGTSVDNLVVAARDTGNTNATYQVDFKKTSGDGTYAYIGHTAGTSASFTNGSTAVTGVGTTWLSHLKAGDKIKATSHSDTVYGEISVVNTDTSITLTSNYTGATVAGVAYIARIILHKDFVPQATVFNNNLVITNGSQTPMTYNDTTLNKITDADAPKGKFIQNHKSRVFIAATSGAPSSIFWSAVNDQTNWDAASVQPIFPQDSGNICAIKSFADSLIVLKDNGNVYQVVGSFDQSSVGDVSFIRKVDTPQNTGAIAGYTVVVNDDNRLYFLAETGLYAIDSSMGVQKVSWDVNTTGIVLRSGLTSNKSYIYDSKTQWDTGTYSGTVTRSNGLMKPYFDVYSITDAYKTPGGCSVYIDSSFNVHVAYIQSADRTKVNYKKILASDQSYNIQQTINFGYDVYGVSLDVSSGGIAGIAVSTFANSGGNYWKRILFSQRTGGTWISPQTANESSGYVWSVNDIYGVSLRFRSDGLARIAAVGGTNANNACYLRQISAGSWNTIVTGGDGDKHIHCSLYLKTDSDPRIAASNYSSNNITLYSGSGGQTSISSGGTDGGTISVTYANSDYGVQLDKSSTNKYVVGYCDNGAFKKRNFTDSTSSTLDSGSTNIFNGYMFNASDQDNFYRSVTPSSTRIQKMTFEGTSNSISTTTQTMDTIVPGDRGFHRNGVVFASVCFGVNANQIVVRRLCYRSTWTGPQQSDSTLTAWGTYDVTNQVTSNATITHEIALNTVSPPSAYNTITSGTVISTDATKIFAKARITFVLGQFSGPTIDALTLNYTGSGVGPTLPTGCVFGNQAYFGYGTTGDSANSTVLLFDRKNVFINLSYPVTFMCRFKKQLYAGSATNGNVYKLLTGYNANGSAYTMTATFKEDLLGSLQLYKDLYKIYVLYQVQTTGSFTVSYRTDNFKTYGGTTYTSATINAATGGGLSQVRLNKLPCSSLQISIANANANQLVGIVGIVILYGYQGLR